MTAATTAATITTLWTAKVDDLPVTVTAAAGLAGADNLVHAGQAA